MRRWSLHALLGALNALAAVKEEDIPTRVISTDVVPDDFTGIVIEAAPEYEIKATSMREHLNDPWRTKNKRGIRRPKKGKRK